MSQELWQRYCKYFKSYPEVGLRMDISRVRFPDDLFAKVADKLNQAFSAMQLLEQGAIANPDENRMVGHYWLRAPELAPTPEITSAIGESLISIKNFARDVHAGRVRPQSRSRFTDVLLLGIGGSALGPQLVSDALGTETDPLTLHFCDNTDPDGIARILARIGSNLDTTLVVVTSKSGGTPETYNGMVEIAHEFSSRKLKFAAHAVAVTSADSKLDKLAIEQGWIRRFPMWDWIGGRTSLFSAVGLLPAALQGIDIDGFLEGGRLMDEITRKPDAQTNPAAILALMWFHIGCGTGKKDMVVLPYKDRLVLFSKYLQQLVMESLGKERNLAGEVVNQGLAVYGNKGSTDQHAYIQQLRDGLNNFFATFVEVLSDYTLQDQEVVEVQPGITSGDYLSGLLLGTREALYQNGRDSITISLEQLTSKTLAALIALYDRAVGFYATMINVNAYHQPGVEAGKKAAAQVIELQSRLLGALKDSAEGAQTAPELASAINAADDTETVFKILEHLAANPERQVQHSDSADPLSRRYFRG